ncbi:hypothetical protein SK128_004506 [Halocaridina rubra]|uniref:Uncharacterized protein n=1 Tax=Halocaridina rubra TaxID=373956 RepID=A0AAN8XC03_HALRR
MEHLEIMPISSRVVCLNAPYLKSLSVFEALSRALGCYYNHHRSQVVSCKATVRLPTPKVVRIKGHTSHIHTPCDTPMLHITIKMGTYLMFYLKDWSQIHKCNLILNGIEKVPKTNVPPKILIERVMDQSSGNQEETYTNDTFSEPSQSNTTTTENNFNANTHQTSHHLLDNVPIKDMIRNYEMNNIKKYTPVHHTKSSPLQQSNREYPSTPHDGERNSRDRQDNRDIVVSGQSITIDMDHSEEITTLLDDENDDESECTSDTSDELHKVVRKRLSVDITSLLHPYPNNNILVLLLRPGEESQAWQFLSACIKVTHDSTKALVNEGTGTIKKALTRTRPLYFSKNGNAHRL